MEEIGPALVLFPLTPRTATKILRRRLKRTLVLMYEIICAYSPFFFNAINSAIRLWCLSASGPIPPVVVRMIGVKDPCSTFKTLSLYLFFFDILMMNIRLSNLHIDVGLTVRMKHLDIEKSALVSPPNTYTRHI